MLPTMGGQTALNCALDLAREGILTRFDVELIGASKKAIDKAEDREKFKAAMTRIGLGSARSGIAHNLEQALAVQQDIGFPAVIRPSFTLGGSALEVRIQQLRHRHEQRGRKGVRHAPRLAGQLAAPGPLPWAA